MTTPDVRDTALPDSPRADEARGDARQLRLHAAGLSYSDTTAEGEAKHRLHEIAMRIETGYYAGRAFKAGVHVGAGLERAALADDRSGAVPPALTDEQIEEIAGECNVYADHSMPGVGTAAVLCDFRNIVEFARAIEAALAAGALQASTASPGGEEIPSLSSDRDASAPSNTRR